MNDEVDIRLLEQYLAGRIKSHQVLYTDGTSVPEEKLQTIIKEFNELKIHLEGTALKSELVELHKTLNFDEERRSFPQWLVIAATVLLLGVISMLIWWIGNSKEPSFDDYFGHFDQLITFRNSDSTSYSSGLEMYSEMDYDSAFVLLERVEIPTPEIKFYLGVSALGSERFKKAIQVFKDLGTGETNTYYQQTRWYLGLAYWQAERLEEAIETLSLISKDEFKYQESVRLMKQLTN